MVTPELVTDACDTSVIARIPTPTSENTTFQGLAVTDDRFAHINALHVRVYVCARHTPAHTHARKGVDVAETVIRHRGGSEAPLFAGQPRDGRYDGCVTRICHPPKQAGS